MPRKKLVRDLSTPEAREIWQFVEKVASKSMEVTPDDMEDKRYNRCETFYWLDYDEMR